MQPMRISSAFSQPTPAPRSARSAPPSLIAMASRPSETEQHQAEDAIGHDSGGIVPVAGGHAARLGLEKGDMGGAPEEEGGGGDQDQGGPEIPRPEGGLFFHVPSRGRKGGAAQAPPCWISWLRLLDAEARRVNLGIAEILQRPGEIALQRAEELLGFRRHIGRRRRNNSPRPIWRRCHRPWLFRTRRRGRPSHRPEAELWTAKPMACLSGRYWHRDRR